MTESLNKYLLALDEGTTNAKATVFNKESSILSSSHFEISLKYPISGWVEQNAEEIWESQLKAIKESLKKAKIEPSRIAALGITNQRETTILWEKSTGKPVYNAIVWQCRRTADTVEELRKLYESLFKEKTGLIPDSYFSGPKIKWVLDNVPNLKDKAIAGELMFGTVDSFLIWKLTNGKKHVIDYSNASRTMMFNIHKMDWDENGHPDWDNDGSEAGKEIHAGSVRSTREAGFIWVEIQGQTRVVLHKIMTEQSEGLPTERNDTELFDYVIPQPR